MRRANREKLIILQINEMGQKDVTTEKTYDIIIHIGHRKNVKRDSFQCNIVLQGGHHMKFWITDGVLHHELTMDMDYFPTREIQVYADEGEFLDIPEDSECVRIPDGVTCIGKQAFETTYFKKDTKWKKLKKVILPDSVKIIEDDAFKACSLLEEINLPAGLEKLGSMALYGTAIRTVNLPEGITEIGGFCFSHSQLENIVFPVSPTRIAATILNGCKMIREITIPEYVKEGWGFQGCSSLEKIVNCKWGNNTSFSGCEKLKEAVIPDGVKEIAMSTFSNCKSIKELTIPASVKKAVSAFDGCTGLEKLTLKSAFKGFETAFRNSEDISEVYITDSASGKARTVFPKAKIFNLKGKLLFSPDQNPVKKNGKNETSSREDDQVTSAAVNGELIPKSNVYKFTKYGVFVHSLDQLIQVEFKGAQMTNRICKARYLGKEEGCDTDKIYDAAELLRKNVNLYTYDPRTGITITTLSKDYEYLGKKRKYSVPLNPEKAKEYVQRFTHELARCLSETSITRIADYVPRKKDGTLAKNRTTLILKSGWADSEGNTLVLMAKNASEKELILEVKKIYIGEDKYRENEAAKVIGML